MWGRARQYERKWQVGQGDETREAGQAKAKWQGRRGGIRRGCLCGKGIELASGRAELEEVDGMWQGRGEVNNWGNVGGNRISKRARWHGRELGDT